MEIISNVHSVDKIISHCYLLVDKEITLIDTGFPIYLNKILRYITDVLHRKPSELKRIILTHGDIDHSGNAFHLKKITGASIAIHEKDADVIAGKTARIFPTSRIGFLLKFFNKRLTTPFDVDCRLSEGDTISGLTVLHIPGHSPGSIALHDINRKILFTGDTLSYHDGCIKGPSKRYSMDLQQAFKSIQKYSTLDFNIMLAGHGEPLLVDASIKVKQFLKK